MLTFGIQSQVRVSTRFAWSIRKCSKWNRSWMHCWRCLKRIEEQLKNSSQFWMNQSRGWKCDWVTALNRSRCDSIIRIERARNRAPIVIVAILPAMMTCRWIVGAKVSSSGRGLCCRSLTAKKLMVVSIISSSTSRFVVCLRRNGSTWPRSPWKV